MREWRCEIADRTSAIRDDRADYRAAPTGIFVPDEEPDLLAHRRGTIAFSTRFLSMARLDSRRYAVSIQCAEYITKMERSDLDLRVRQYFIVFKKATKAKEAQTIRQIPLTFTQALHFAAVAQPGRSPSPTSGSAATCRPVRGETCQSHRVLRSLGGTKSFRVQAWIPSIPCLVEGRERKE